MTVLAPTRWWRGLGALTRSGSSMSCLYGLVGKFSAAVGPIIYGIIVASLLATLDRDAYRVAIASLFVLLLVGIWILRGVPAGEPENEEAAADAMVEGMNR